MRYWDSSALVPLVVNEAETGHRQSQLRQDHRVITWWGSWIECASALNRLHREGSLDSQGLGQALEKLRRYAGIGCRSVPRSGCGNVPSGCCASIHCVLLTRCSYPLRWRGDDNPATLAVVCSDQRLSDAAVKEGFVVL